VLSLTTTLQLTVVAPGPITASPMTLTKDVPLTADMSVAPEIARLAEAVLLIPAQGPQTAPPDGRAEHSPTLGALAGRLRSIAATPERWWGLVRFEPGRSVQITVEECAAYRAWLVVLPPGGAGQSCDCDVATMIAGEATEGTSASAEGASASAGGTSASAVLRPGPVRVHGERHAGRHGERHRLHGRGTGYSISLHVRAHRS
jgi:hypothetical protein